MIEVLAILPNDMAIVSTQGLHRVTETTSGEIVEELLDRDGVVSHVACCVQSSERESVARYSDLHHQAEFNAQYYGLAPVSRNAPEILAVLPGCVVVSSKGLRRVVVEPHAPSYVVRDGDQIVDCADGPTHILAELVSKSDAKRLAAKFEHRPDARAASIVRYDDLAPCGFAVDVARGKVIDGSGDVGQESDDAPLATESAEPASAE